MVESRVAESVGLEVKGLIIVRTVSETILKKTETLGVWGSFYLWWDEKLSGTKGVFLGRTEVPLY